MPNVPDVPGMSDWRKDDLPCWHLGYPKLLPWVHIPTEEPLSPELRAKVRQNLIQEAHIRDHLDPCIGNRKDEWRDGMPTRDNPRFINGPPFQLEISGVQDLLNRDTSLYWLPSPTSASMVASMLFLGCIIKKWFEYHGGRPYTKHQSFFSNLIRIDPSRCETTVQEILQLHKSLINQAVSFRERLLREKDTGKFDASHWDMREPFGVMRFTNTKSYWIEETQNYDFKPTFRAIIMIMDRQHWPKTFPARLKSVHDLDECSKEQTVLLIRTGDDSHLESPITFGELKTSGLSQPVDRFDVPADSADVVRVSLTTAVNFISDLDRREDMAHPSLARSREILDEERRVEEYADQALNKADEQGVDNVKETWFAVRRVKAAMMGDDTFPQLKMRSYDSCRFLCHIT